VTDKELLNCLDDIARQALDHNYPQSSLTGEWALGELGSRCSAEQQALVHRTTAHWNRVIVHLLEADHSPIALCGCSRSLLEDPPRLQGNHIFWPPPSYENSPSASGVGEICSKCVCLWQHPFSE
jgi:hypothetical protein